MPITPLRIAQTSKEVKREYKKNGSRLPERQMRQLERAAELEERAARFREADERKKSLKKKREQKEIKEREMRRQMGVGLATQLVGYSHTQAKLKNGMEAFLGLKKKQKEDNKRQKEMEVSNKIEEIIEAVEKEPWDDDGGDTEKMMSDLSNFDTHTHSPEWLDDELDDDTLLEAHDLLLSDPADNLVDVPSVAIPSPALAPAPVLGPQKPVVRKEDTDFVRLHGPTNKTVEDILENLSEPVIELLSRDAPVDKSLWNPVDALLHKLNPIGVPPHRLRIKMGCVVVLLRDLNISSQLSKSQHLRILRVENERLECQVLDGQLVGTKTFLTRVPFATKHRGEEKCSYIRTQYPIRVTPDTFSSSDPPRHPPSTTFKLPSVSNHIPRSMTRSRNPPSSGPKSRINANSNPRFKLPGLPASKAKMPMQSKPTASPPCCILDDWDDFLTSGTQLARELSPKEPSHVTDGDGTCLFGPLSTQDLKVLSGNSEKECQSNPATSETLNPVMNAVKPQVSIRDMLPPLSTQDLDFSLDDLDELEKKQPKQTMTETNDLLPKIEGSRVPPVPNAKATPKITNQHLAKVSTASPMSSQEFNFSLEDDLELIAEHLESTEKVGCSLVVENKSMQPATSRLKALPSAPVKPGPPTKRAINPMSTVGKSLPIAKPPPAPAKTATAHQPPPHPAQKELRIPNLKRKSLPASARNPLPPAKRLSLPAGSFYQEPASKPHVSIPTLISFSDFGLSTQDAVSMFDDDDDINLDSPPNIVMV